MVVFQPELSVPALAGSVVLPLAKDGVSAVTREAVPVPTEGVVLPVLGSASGLGLLKFHCAMTLPVTGGFTVNTATALVTLPTEFVTTTV